MIYRKKMTVMTKIFWKMKIVQNERMLFLNCCSIQDCWMWASQNCYLLWRGLGKSYYWILLRKKKRLFDRPVK